MSNLADLGRLLSLRRRREEGARAVVKIAAGRLLDAEHALAIADAEIEAHDREAGQQEERFLAAMGIRPISDTELGRSRDLFGVFGHKRQGLVVSRDAASEVVAECAAAHAAAQAGWRRSMIEHDRLAEAERQLREQVRGQSDAASELETEEMSSDRARMSC